MKYTGASGRGPVGDAVAHPRPDVGQVRIGVLRLDDLLLVGQLRSQFHAVVVIFATLREERVKRPEKLRKQVWPVVHPRREALIEIAGGGVERAVQRPAMAVENVAGDRLRYGG